MSEPTSPNVPGSAPAPAPTPDPTLLLEPPAPVHTPTAPFAGYGTVPPIPPHYSSPAPVAPAATTGYPPSGYAPSGYAPSAGERNWAVAAHLSGFLAAFVALGFLGPLIVLLTEGSRSPYVRRHAVAALNFNLSVLLWVVVSAVLMIVLVGFLTMAAVGIMYLVASILGAMAASRGDDFRYPLTIRFVN
jgi:uncharacterized Tic20 family protein